MDYSTGKEACKCADCGYLSTIDPSKPGELVGVERKRRDSWELPVVQDQTPAECPICWVGANPIDKEATSDSCIEWNGGKRKFNFSSEVKKDRKCQEWTRWIVGLSPKAHWDMGLVQDERDWREKCDKEREERNAQFKKESDDRFNAFQQKMKKFDRKWALINGVAIVVFSTIISQANIFFLGKIPKAEATKPLIQNEDKQDQPKEMPPAVK